MDFSAILKEAGPYTAPLCGAMVFAVRWLLTEREELLEALQKSQQREREMGERRTQELLESAAAMAEVAKMSEKTLSGHSSLLTEAIRKWESSKPS